MGKSYKEVDSKKLKSGRLRFAALIVVFAAIGGFALYNLLSLYLAYTAAQNEYERLREFAPGISQDSIDSSPDASEPFEHLISINPDYIGWLYIEGTRIDYPIVQSFNNHQYLTTTFEGQNNASGAIFMDSRIENGFNGFSLLHGHNMRDGSMFADLFLFKNDEEFRERHTEILVVPLHGELLRYRVFDIRYTDVNDKVYSLIGSDRASIYEYFSQFGIPEWADIIALSTCAHDYRDGRLLILGVAE